MSTIHQEVTFSAPPQRIYQALTSGEQFAGWSGAPAEIGSGDGGAFSCFGGMITGRNVEAVPGERLVQAWRAGNWAPGVYSIARFSLAADGAGTRLTFDQAGYPEGMGEHLKEGWQKMYWDKIAAAIGG
jgi:activator of HSP90 ATPase